MPGKKKPGPSVKDDKVYEAIRDQGGSKEKAARIANASAARGRSSVGKKGGTSGSYDDWKVEDLRKRPRSSACRATQARRSPNWYRCCVITDECPAGGKRASAEGREMKEDGMSQGTEASARAIDDVIARAVRELDLEDKVELLTGAAAFSLHGNEAIGLRPMIFSDGPTGVRGSEFVGGKKVALFPTRRCSRRPGTRRRGAGRRDARR